MFVHFILEYIPCFVVTILYCTDSVHIYVHDVSLIIDYMKKLDL